MNTRGILVASLVIVTSISCGGGSESKADGGSATFVERGTVTGTSGFTVRAAKSIWEAADGGAIPKGVILSDRAGACPSLMESPPSGTNILLFQKQSPGPLTVGVTQASTLTVIRGVYGDAGFPDPVGPTTQAGTLTLTSLDGGIVGSFQLDDGTGGGALTGDFAASPCGPY
jgi:hypothetical protein